MQWLDELDFKSQTVILARIARIRLGNFGDSKPIKGIASLWELRINYGPGYRIYFGKEKVTYVVILIGGHKDTQKRDIEKAKRYWLRYRESLHE